MRTPRSRRQILGSALASGRLLSLVDSLSTFAENAPPTPQCHDNHETTIRQTEGPYFKPSSPERADLVEPDTTGRPVEIDGQVTTRSCRPVARALVDLWHADENGEYEFRLPLSRTPLDGRRGSLSFPNHRARPLSGPHPSLSLQSAGSRAGATHDPTLFSGRTRQSPRRAIPPRFGDARGGSAGRPQSALRFCPQHAVVNSQRDKGMGRLIPGRRNRFDLADTRWNTGPRRGGLLTGAKPSGRPPRESA